MMLVLQEAQAIHATLREISRKLDCLNDDHGYSFVKERGDKIAQLEQRIEALESWVLGQIGREPKTEAK